MQIKSHYKIYILISSFIFHKLEGMDQEQYINTDDINHNQYFTSLKKILRSSNTEDILSIIDYLYMRNKKICLEILFNFNNGKFDDYINDYIKENSINKYDIYDYEEYMNEFYISDINNIPKKEEEQKENLDALKNQKLNFFIHFFEQQIKFLDNFLQDLELFKTKTVDKKNQVLYEKILFFIFYMKEKYVILLKEKQKTFDKININNLQKKLIIDNEVYEKLLKEELLFLQKEDSSIKEEKNRVINHNKEQQEKEEKEIRDFNLYIQEVLNKEIESIWNFSQNLKFLESIQENYDKTSNNIINIIIRLGYALIIFIYKKYIIYINNVIKNIKEKKDIFILESKEKKDIFLLDNILSIFNKVMFLYIQEQSKKSNKINTFIPFELKYKLDINVEENLLLDEQEKENYKKFRNKIECLFEYYAKISNTEINIRTDNMIIPLERYINMDHEFTKIHYYFKVLPNEVISQLNILYNEIIDLNDSIMELYISNKFSDKYSKIINNLNKRISYNQENFTKQLRNLEKKNHLEKTKIIKEFIYNIIENNTLSPFLKNQLISLYDKIYKINEKQNSLLLFVKNKCNLDNKIYEINEKEKIISDNIIAILMEYFTKYLDFLKEVNILFDEKIDREIEFKIQYIIQYINIMNIKKNYNNNLIIKKIENFLNYLLDSLYSVFDTMYLLSEEEMNKNNLENYIYKSCKQEIIKFFKNINKNRCNEVFIYILSLQNFLKKEDLTSFIKELNKLYITTHKKEKSQYYQSPQAINEICDIIGKEEFEEKLYQPQQSYQQQLYQQYPQQPYQQPPYPQRHQPYQQPPYPQQPYQQQYPQRQPTFHQKRIEPEENQKTEKKYEETKYNKKENQTTEKKYEETKYNKKENKITKEKYNKEENEEQYEEENQTTEEISINEFYKLLKELLEQTLMTSANISQILSYMYFRYVSLKKVTNYNQHVLKHYPENTKDIPEEFIKKINNINHKCLVNQKIGLFNMFAKIKLDFFLHILDEFLKKKILKK